MCNGTYDDQYHHERGTWVNEKYVIHGTVPLRGSWLVANVFNLQ